MAARVLPDRERAADGAGSIRFPAGDCALVGAQGSRAGAPPSSPAYPDVLYGGGVVGCVSLSVRDTAAYTDAIADYTPANQVPPPEAGASVCGRGRERPGEVADRLRHGIARARCRSTPIWRRRRRRLRRRCASHWGMTSSRRGSTTTSLAMAEIERRFVTILHAMVYDFARQEFGREPAEDEFSTFVRRSAAEAGAMSGLQHASDIAAYRRLSADMLAISEPYDVVLTPNRVISTPRVGRQNVATTPYEEYWRQIMLEDIPVHRRRELDRPARHIGAGALERGRCADRHSVHGAHRRRGDAAPARRPDRAGAAVVRSKAADLLRLDPRGANRFRKQAESPAKFDHDSGRGIPSSDKKN